MDGRRETALFAALLAIVLGVAFRASLLFGMVLSPADVIRVQSSVGGPGDALYEPANRLLMDPALQFEPWLEFSRASIRRGRLPLWNDLAGCGAPFLANGQSGVFDPFHLIAYLGTMPGALAWIAASRLFVAGLGMFRLARCWGLGPWGRWFAGLAFPWSGFLVVWLLYPLASVAAWLPWIFLGIDRAIARRDARSVALLGLATAAMMLGGHVQTSAHILIAATAYLLVQSRPFRSAFPLACGIALGLAMSAAAVLPLAGYLAQSPVWSDRKSESPPVWAVERPRLLDAAAVAFPSMLGSQRRGQPNLAKALGAHNQNESAGGFAGLATVALLAPLGLRRGWRDGRTRFLGALVAIGFLGAFRFPPVENFLTLIPILDVIDHRRLSLWVSFGLVMLGGIGLDHLGDRLPGRALRLAIPALLTAAVACAAFALVVPRFEPAIRARAEAHYAGFGGEEAAAKADRQVRNTLAFVPAHAAFVGAQLAGLGAIAGLLAAGRLPLGLARGGLAGLALLDLLAFARGLNPEIPAADYRRESPVIARLREGAAPPRRVLAVGEELPPNTLMRFGLADLRNYDSIELTRGLDAFAGLYENEPGRPSRTSRRPVTWAGVIRCRETLQGAGVAAVVGATPPPDGAFGRVEREGSVYIAWLDGEVDPRGDNTSINLDHGIITVSFESTAPRPVEIPVAYSRGWRGLADGHPVAVGPSNRGFLRAEVPAGIRRLTLNYDPIEARAGIGLSLIAAGLAAAGLAAPAGPRKVGLRPWRRPESRVRIIPMSRAGGRARHSNGGRDAHGPLHV